MKKLLLFVFSISVFQIGYAQQKGQLPTKSSIKRTTAETQITSKRNFKNLPITNRGLQMQDSKFRIKQLQPKLANGLNVKMSDKNGRPISISGKIDNSVLKTNDLEVVANYYLEKAGNLLQIENPSEEFQLKENKVDELQISHLKYQQTYKGLPVFGAEVILHEKDGSIYLLNGRSFSTPKIENIQPQLTDNQSVELVKLHLSSEKNIEFVEGLTEKEIGNDQVQNELVIYFPKGNNANSKLVYHISIYPNRIKRFEYFVDANTGEIIDHHSSFCQFSHYELKGAQTCNHNHDDNDYKIPLTFESSETSVMDGPTVATARDLNNVNRTVNTYQVGANYFMIDAKKDMFKPNSSTLPNNGVGVIWTIDGKGGTPARQSNFNPVHVTSQNNTWTDRRAVSAHYNGEVAYNYFRTVHNRNSVNHQGGNIMSFYNIAEDDGSDMDNAFWNGAHIYYGNGAQAFTSSLAKSLDVAGHEMSHGVVQTTANLRYQGESGALNESFADIFAAMMDRDNWKIGEEVVNTQIFRSGAMRDLSNPNNGGNSLNDEGYQPDDYNKRFTGSQDNGGVHINSGIPNHAFYLFATNAAVGKERAEKVFYRALDNYLVASSQFIDLRAAAAQSAMDLYGTSVANALHEAMDAVNIPGGTPNNYQDDLDENPGTDFCILTDENASAIYLAEADGSLVGNPFNELAPISKPSVSDDGAFALFVAEDMHIYEIDFNAGTVGAISSAPIWRNAAISKDGNRAAALSDENDNGLYIFDFVNGGNKKFDLYNPTFTQGVSTGEVKFADVIEWDYSGEWVMYDALNGVDGDFGEIEYWDIGFVNVWNTQSSDFRDGEVSKLYSLVPENVSIGNPTFSKLSPYIIAFDYHEDGQSAYDLLTANLETGDVSDPPIFRNSSWNVPNFTPNDKQISFDGSTNSGSNVLALLGLTSDKLSSSGNPSVFLEGGRRGVWFANGVRDVTSAEDIDNQSFVNVFPNPSTGEITIELENDLGQKVEAQFFDLLGRPFSTQKLNQGKNQINLEFLSDGTYFVSIKSDGQIIRTERLMILR